MICVLAKKAAKENNNMAKYYTSTDARFGITHAYKDSGADKIIHLNLTHPMVNIINRNNFVYAEQRDGGKIEISEEQFINERNKVLAELDLI